MVQPKPIRRAVIAKTLSVWLVITAWALLDAGQAAAQGSDDQRREAITNAMSQAGGYGKVLSVKPYKTPDGKPGFRIRILSDGKVRTFDIAANQGR